MRSNHDFVKSKIISKHILKAKFSSNPQRQRETIIKIRYPQIFELEKEYDTFNGNNNFRNYN